MKKRKSISPDDVKRWIAKGDGQGEGREYRPFFHVRDVPSRGRSSMVLGLKTGRIHHYLSDLEYACHLLAEFEKNVTDIRERMALLSWKETQTIAEGLGIRHPIYPCTSTPVLMTSDLVVTLEQDGVKSYEIICVKPSSELTLLCGTSLSPSAIKKKNNRIQRSMENLLIEKTYWELRAVPWRLVTEQDIPMIRVRNLDLFRATMVAEELDRLNPQMESFLTTFDGAWTSNRTLLQIPDQTGNKIGLSRDKCFTLLGRAVWLRLLPVDLDKKIIHHDKSLPRIKEEQGEDRC